MQNRTPVPRDQRPPLPDFAPVPRKPRSDGWTPERQKAFIEALAETGSVKHAAKAINMSPEGAYYLRRQPGAEEFRAAWEAALDHGVRRLVDVTMDRAINGVAVPVFWRGEQVGERRAYNDRLAMFHLRHRLPDRYGALNAPGRGTRHPDTIAREYRESNEERDRAVAELKQRLETELDTIHARWRAHLAEQGPEHIAAYELLFGPDGEGERRHSTIIRIAHLAGRDAEPRD
jgi:molybdenum-dependent DNA-binding transcriptional regulator ModE